MEQHYLTPLFNPQSILLFSHAEQAPEKPDLHDQAGHLLAQFLAQPFKGKVTHVNAQVANKPSDLAQFKADLALIALPANEVTDALELAGRMNCKAALVALGGMPDALAEEMRQVARKHDMWLLGPNSAGFQRPALNLNASRVSALAASGQLGLVSQSGSLMASILDWARQNRVGFSSVIAVGPHTQVDLADALDFLAADKHTHSIVVYMEGILHARRFMSALRAAAIAKPVVVLKAGRQQTGVTAATTHSATLAGQDSVFDAALRRAGAVRVRSFVELFSAAKCLAARYRPVGKRLAVITNGGGPGVLAADWVSALGLDLAIMPSELAEKLRPDLPGSASMADLIDLSEDADAKQYQLALEAAVKEKTIDGVLVIYSPKPGGDAEGVARAVVQLKPRFSNKPLVTCWMGDATVNEARRLLADAQIPTFRTPEAAVGAFGNISSFYQNQQLLQQTPPPLTHLRKPDVEGARLLIEAVLAERRRVLTEMESKALLSAFNIPVTSTILARSATEAMMIAAQQGFPVVLKIDSPDIAHKSDVGGVVLNLTNASAVRDAYQDMMQRVTRAQPKARINGITVQAMARARRGRELFVGVNFDQPFGPVISFGAGGTMAELMSGSAMELPPLNQFLARRLIDRAQVAETLGQWRGAAAADRAALEQVLLRVSEMVCELPQLRQVDINPIIVDENGVVAVDARVVVWSTQEIPNYLSGPYGHLSILPYPGHYKQTWPLPGGGEYTIRPIRPDDAQMLQQLVQNLTPESRYFRFVSSMAQLPPSMLSRFTLIDYDREMALCAVVEEEGEEGVKERTIGVSRYVTNPDQSSCEFSLLVDDGFAGKGIGSRLMLSIMDIAREKGLEQIVGLVLANNGNMLKLMKSLGFVVKPYPDDPEFRLVVHTL